MNDASTATGTRLFQVRFGPPAPPSGNEAWPNNLQLAGRGTVEVSSGTVKFSDLRGASLEKHRTFALQDIANVGYGHAEDVIVLRTRNDDREVYFWPESREDTRALLALLPAVTTPLFLEHQARQHKFHAAMAALAPKAPVTPTIVGLNVAVFVVMLIAGAGLMGENPDVHLRFGSDYGPLTWGGEPWRLLTAAFIHFGIVHLAFNMYALYSGGMLTERLYGSARFALIYLLSALSGSVVSDWWNATRNSAGASGAVFGVYGALLVFFALRRADIPPSLLKTAGRGAITLCVYSLGMGAVLPFVNNAAHVGGLLGGAIAGLLLVRPFEPAARAVAQPWKLVVVACGACAALALLAAPLWSPSGERGLELRFEREVRGYRGESRQLHGRFLEIMQGVTAGKLAATEAASQLRREVLGPWHAATRRLLDVPPIEPAESIAARRLVVFKAFAQAREVAIGKSVDALEQPTDEAGAAATAAWQRAKELASELEALDSGKR